MSDSKQIDIMPAISGTTTLRIRHNGHPDQAQLDLVAPDGSMRPLELVESLEFKSVAGQPSTLHLDFVCFGTLEVTVPLSGDVVARIVDTEQMQELGAAIHGVPRGGASGDAPAWLVRLHRAACAVMGIEVVGADEPRVVAGDPPPSVLLAGVPIATVARLAGALLQAAAPEFANHGCNEFDLARWCPDVAERRALVCAYHQRNGDPGEFDPQRDYRIVNDASLMWFLSELLAGGGAR